MYELLNYHNYTSNNFILSGKYITKEQLNQDLMNYKPTVNNILNCDFTHLSNFINFRLGTYNWFQSSWANQIFTFGPISRPKKLSIKSSYTREQKCSAFKVFAWNVNKTTKYLLYGFVDRYADGSSIGSQAGHFWNNDLTACKKVIENSKPIYNEFEFDLSSFNSCFTQNEKEVYISIDCNRYLRSVDGTVNFDTFKYLIEKIDIEY